MNEGSRSIKWAGPKTTAFHAIWGWLEIAEVIAVDAHAAPPWAVEFPHFMHKSLRVGQNNTVYMATERLSLEPSLPGGVVFERYRDELRLSAPGGCVAWELSPALDEMAFAHVRPLARGVPRSRWNSSGQWQETVGASTPAARDWLAGVFRGETIERSSSLPA